MNPFQLKFPLLKESAGGLAYLDNAATTQKPECVVSAINSFYQTSNANVHRGVYALSEASTAQFELSRKTVARFLNAHSDEVIFTSGATASLNELALGIEREFSERDTLLLSEAEHHSNLLPWMRLAERKKCRIAWLPINEQGQLDLQTAKMAFESHSVKLVAIATASHVLGNRQPYEEIVRLANTHGAISVLDATQSVARERLDVKSLGCSALVFSGHKVYGPTGVGVLWTSRGLQNLMEPAFVGGGMVDLVSKSGARSWRAAPWKFEAGTPAVEAVIGLKAALDFVETEQLHSRATTERLLIRDFARYLATFPFVSLFGWAANLSEESDLSAHEGILSFYLEGLHPHDVAQTLAETGVAVRAGHHCAQILTEQLSPEGCVRISLAAYSSSEDLEMFKAGFERCLKLRKEMEQPAWN